MIGNKRRRTGYSESRSRSKRMKLGDNSEPILNGMHKDVVISQVTVSENFIPTSNLDTGRKFNMGRSDKDYIVGGFVGDKQNVLLSRARDPLFSLKSDLRNLGRNDAPVFTALNGLPHKNKDTSYDLDEDFKFVAFAIDSVQPGQIASHKVRQSGAISGYLGVLNNGPDILSAGDLVGYFVPFYDKRQNLHPNEKWVATNTGSEKTSRLLPHLRKITPSFLTDTLRQPYYKLLIAADGSQESNRLFPSINYLQGYDPRSFSKTSPQNSQEQLASSIYTDKMFALFAGIVTLISHGVITGTDKNTDWMRSRRRQGQDDDNDEQMEDDNDNDNDNDNDDDDDDDDEVSETKAKENLIKKIFTSLGFVGFNKEGMNKDMIKDYLNLYFCAFTGRNNRNRVKTKLKTHFPFLGNKERKNIVTMNMLLDGAKNAQDSIYKFLMSRMGKVVGRITLGGLPKKPVRIDSRAGYYM